MARKVKTTWSKGQEWGGFCPTAYTLNLQRMSKLQLFEGAKSSADEQGPFSRTNVVRAFSALRGEEISEMEEGFRAAFIVKSDSGDQTLHDMPDLTIRTNSGGQRFAGPPFSLAVLHALLRLHKAGADALDASWFCYDSDSAAHDPHHSYAFFVVCGGKIVEERASFSDYSNSGFDPTIFSTTDEHAPIWLRQRDWEEADVRFWYRKFYTETRIGQLMVLRPDEPELYFYPEGRWTWTSPFAFAGLQSRLQTIMGLLIALVVIGLLALILLWR